MSNERDPDFDAIKERDIFDEARDRLALSLDHDHESRQDAKEAILFREGENHWDSEYVTTQSAQSPELVINLTDAMVQRIVNNIKQQRPRGKAHPVGDGADIELADLINGIGRHVEYRSEASVAYDTAAESAVTAGFGYCRMITEYVAADSFQKDLRILPIPNIFTVYMDPGALMPAGQDAMWCLISTKMKRTEYKRRYPHALNVAWNDTGRDEWRIDWEDQEEIRLAEYFRIREKTDTLYELTASPNEKYPQGTVFTLFKDQLPPLRTLKANGLAITQERESARRTVEWFRLNGTKVIEREILPGTYIPVFRCLGNRANADGKIMIRGVVKNMMDPQRMVDYGETAKIKRLGLAPQAQWVAAEGQLDGHPEWDGSNVSAYMTLTYKPITVMTAQGEQLLPPPTRQPPPQIEAGFAEFVQGMRTNLLAVAGMPNEPGADMQGQVVSGQAIKRRQGLSDQSHYQYYDNVTLMIAQIWRVMLEYMSAVYWEPGRIQRIIGDDGTPELATLNEATQEEGTERIKNDMSIGRYDVVMDTGPGYETKREEGAENLMELLQVQALAEIIAKTGPDLVFRSIDHPYMQELADRLMAQNPEGLKKVLAGLSSRARSLVQSLSNQIQQLTQQNQQLQTDLKQGITKAHLAATVKAHDVEESNKTKRADTESRERTQIHTTAMKIHGDLLKEEIGVTGKLLDTHTQAGYDERAADKMIAQGEAAEKSAET